MKNLEFNQMENLSGGDQRNCLILGGTILGTALAQQWPYTFAAFLAATALDCF